MNRQFTIQPGRAVNQEEVIRSLKEKGYYSSGIPRPSERGATGSGTSSKKKSASRLLSSKQMRYLDEEDLKRYIEDHG